jgi:hypothetical protein
MAINRENRIIYLQMALIGLFVGVLFTGLKMIWIDWGEHTICVWNESITINSLIYYNCQNVATAGFAATIASGFTYISELNKSSIIAFICKYLSILVALTLISRVVFGIIFYNNITLFELIMFVVLLIYTTFRGLIFYRNNLKVDGKHFAA